MKQYKEEWDLVMYKLERIASLVDRVRLLCEKNNMETTDVPRSLLAIFESLVTYVRSYPILWSPADRTLKVNWMGSKTRLNRTKKPEESRSSSCATISYGGSSNMIASFRMCSKLSRFVICSLSVSPI